MNNGKTGIYGLVLLMGVMSSMMSFFNGILAKYTNIYLGSIIVHLTGLIPTVALFIAYDRDKVGRWAGTFRSNKYIFTGGLLGAVMVIGGALCVNLGGVFLYSMAALVGQFILSLILDLKGLFGFEKLRLDGRKAAAIMIIAAGAVMMSL